MRSFIVETEIFETTGKIQGPIDGGIGSLLTSL